MTFSVSRRQFLQRSAQTAGVGLTLQSLLGRHASVEGAALGTEGFGPLRPVEDQATGLPLISLPEGFRYSSYGWQGDEMTDGVRTPAVHDGMAVVAQEGDVVTLVRNHEISNPQKAFGASGITYDAMGGAGCTSLRFDVRKEKWLDSRVSLAGTCRNCAGGPTPWGSWLTCEETIAGPDRTIKGKRQPFEQTHGWVFEVPANDPASAQPIKEMGRFWHEAVAVDPRDGIVYLTEDRGTAGFYRFLPRVKGQLSHGGRLQMLAARNASDLRKGSDLNQTYDVRWVDIEEPERPGAENDLDDDLGVFRQGRRQGAAQFARLEGCGYQDGKVFFTATSGGKAGRGQVWQFDPEQQTLTLIYESPGEAVLDMPDNLAVSPNGDVILCEDGHYTPQRVHVLTPDGRLNVLAENNVMLDGQKVARGKRGDYRDQEWCGATFSADGQWLFLNIQTPGITFAVTGPWESLRG